AVGVDFDMGVLDVRLQFQPAPGEAVADIDERLAAVGVVAAGQGVGVATEGDRAVDLDFVLAAGMAQRQAEAAPRGAGIDADVGAAGLAARAAATHVEVGVAGAAEHADAPAGVEGVVDAHQHGVAAVPGPRRVAVGGDLAALVLDLHPGAGIPSGFHVERVAAGPAQGRIADQAAAFQQDLLGAGVDFAGEAVERAT